MNIEKYILIMLVAMSCGKQEGKLELILDTYIDYYKLDKAQHYIIMEMHKWNDTTNLLIISFQYFKDGGLETRLPSVPHSSYKDINIYTDFPSLPIFPSHNLHFKSISPMSKPKDELDFGSEYFNDVQILYDPKRDCVPDVLQSGYEAKGVSYSERDIHFIQKFKGKGLMCP